LNNLIVPYELVLNISETFGDILTFFGSFFLGATASLTMKMVIEPTLVSNLRCDELSMVSSRD